MGKKETIIKIKYDYKGCDDCPKTVTLDIPDGFELIWNSEYELSVKEISKRPTWEDFGEVKGWYVDGDGDLVSHANRACLINKNTFPSREEAEACVALSQLLQWRDKYNEGWKAEWIQYETMNWRIVFYADEPSVDHTPFRGPLSFKSYKIANKFLEDFRELIKTAKPLL